MMERDANYNRVARISLWKIREARRREATARGKSQIQKLMQRVEVLEGALTCWQQWYSLLLEGNWQWPTQAAREEEEEEEAEETAIAEVTPPIKMQHSVIDYSKWDHIECDDDEDDEEEDEEPDYTEDELDGYWDSCTGAEDEENECQDAADEENDEENGDSGDEDGCDCEEAKQIDENLQSVEVDDEDARATAEAGLTDDGEKNQEVLLQVLQKTKEDAADLIIANESTTADQDQLKEQYINQLAKLLEMVRSMRVEQFDRAGTNQVLQVFHSWQADFQHRWRTMLADAG